MRTLLLALLALAAPAALAQYLPAGAEQWYLRTDDGVSLYVVEVGRAEAAGDTVLVLHGGFGADHSYLFDAVLPLADGRRFVLYDQRGSLRSPAPDSLLSLDAMVADVEALRADLGLDRVTLLGHSMGTALAYAYLAAHPDRVANLVLTGPVFPFPPASGPSLEVIGAMGLPMTDSTYAAAEKARYDAFRQETAAREAAELSRAGLDRPARSGRESTDQWRIAFAAANIYHADRWRQVMGGQVFYNPAVYRNLVRSEGGADAWNRRWGAFHPALQAYGGPITYVVGEQDFIDPGATAWPALVTLFPNATLDLVPEAGHNLWIDQPERFEAAVRRALERTRAAG